MRSIRTRLLAVSVLIALVGVALTAFIADAVGRDQTRSEVERVLREQGSIASQLDSYALDNWGWDGVQEVVDSLAEQTGLRIVIRDLEGRRVLADSASTSPDQAKVTLDDSPTRFLDPLFDLSVGDLLTGVDSGAGPETTDIDEAEFTAALEDCLTAAGIDYEILVDPDTGLTYPQSVVPGEDEQCLTSTFAEFGLLSDTGTPTTGDPGDDLGPAPEPVLLYLGYRSGRGLTGSTGGSSPVLILVVIGVVALAAFLTAMASRRILGPVSQLTRAARQIESGGVAEPVEVRSRDELGELARAFNQMGETLETEDRLRRRLTSDIAHELRTPLSNILGYLEAADDGLVPRDEALTATLIEEANALKDLIDDLQTLSLAESGGLVMEPVTTDLADLVESVVAANSARAVEEGVGLHSRIPESVRVTVDPRRLRQVLTNLVSNAIRHTDEGGSVTLEVRSSVGSTLGVDPFGSTGSAGGGGAGGEAGDECDPAVAGAAEAGEEVVIRVVDTGSGIEARHLDHIFDRFYRVEDARGRATGGSGLGLAISRQLVDLMGGTLEASSEPGRGSVFTVRLTTGGPHR